MSGNAAVDSNAYVALCSADVNAASLIGSCETVFLPVIVLGELLYGANASGRSVENRRKVEEFARECTVLEITRGVAERYAELKLRLRTAGRPIPDNDLWIAACCIAAGIPLITRDGHFSQVHSLQVLSW
jgi:tRNA(fMet)-specific endonuclease VapC